MDPSNYRIHKKPQPAYRPRANTSTSNISRRPAGLQPPRVSPVSSATRVVKQPSLSAGSKRLRAPAVAPKPHIASPRHPSARQAYTSTPPPHIPRPTNDKPEYTYSAPAEKPKTASKKTNKSRKKVAKRLVISFILLMLLAGIATGGYYYFSKSKIAAKSTASASTTNTQNEQQVGVDFDLYKTKDGGVFKSEDEFSNGKQQSKILIANSTKDNRQIVLTQQKVDKYFTTDPNGLDKLLQSVGQNSATATKDGMSYIVKGNTTALTVKGETLIVVRSTAELTPQEWINLFNDLVLVK